MFVGLVGYFFCLVFVLFFKEKTIFMHQSPLLHGLRVARNKTHFCVLLPQKNMSFWNVLELSFIISLLK